MNYLTMRSVVVGVVKLFIYFVDGRVADLKQTSRVFSVDLVVARFYGLMRIIK